jgi:hypothetical protein
MEEINAFAKYPEEGVEVFATFEYLSGCSSYSLVASYLHGKWWDSARGVQIEGMRAIGWTPLTSLRLMYKIVRE